MNMNCVYLLSLQVMITPEVTSRKMKKNILTELVKHYRSTELGMRLPVYDGGRNLYTAGLLPFTSKEFTVILAHEEEGTTNPRQIFFFSSHIFAFSLWENFDSIWGNRIREREFKVQIKFVSLASMHQLRELLAGKQVNNPQDALAIIDIVLRELHAQRFESNGPFFWFLFVGFLFWLLYSFQFFGKFQSGIIDIYQLGDSFTLPALRNLSMLGVVCKHGVVSIKASDLLKWDCH